MTDTDAVFWRTWMVHRCAAKVCQHLGRDDIAAALRQLPPLDDPANINEVERALRRLVNEVSRDETVGGRLAAMLIVVRAGLVERPPSGRLFAAQSAAVHAWWPLDEPPSSPLGWVSTTQALPPPRHQPAEPPSCRSTSSSQGAGLALAETVSPIGVRG